jgi:3-oxoacyl-[acyl-carrier-protein] synthase-3
MAIEITGTGSAVPSNRVTNNDLALKMDTSDEWIRSHTGIGARHLAGEDTAASDLAMEAAEKALAMAAEKRGLSRETLLEQMDIIVVATASPDYIGCPSVACLVQGRIGARQAAAMDITAGCTGFLYGLETAAGLLSVNPERKLALVIGAEILSKFTDWDDRSSCVLFGDGAGAVVVEKTVAPCSGPEKRGLLRTILGADGSGAHHLVFERGGSRFPFKKGEIVEKPTHLEMNGQAVYNFAVKTLASLIEELCVKEGITIDDVSRIIPHQANARIVQAAAKRLGIPDGKFFLNIEEYANTSSATIPIALDELNRSGGLNTGDLVMSIGFGGGLTFGGNLFIW